jgi:predicted Zn-ribbon and HTH transcriptional regulator
VRRRLPFLSCVAVLEGARLLDDGGCDLVLSPAQCRACMYFSLFWKRGI